MKRLLILVLLAVAVSGCGSDPLGATTRTDIQWGARASIASSEARAETEAARLQADAQRDAAQAQTEAARLQAEAQVTAAWADAEAKKAIAEEQRRGAVAVAEEQRRADETTAQEARRASETWAATMPILLVLLAVLVMGSIWFWWNGKTTFTVSATNAQTLGVLAIEEKRRLALMNHARDTGARMIQGPDVGSYLLEYPTGEQKLYLPKSKGGGSCLI